MIGLTRRGFVRVVSAWLARMPSDGASPDSQLLALRDTWRDALAAFHAALAAKASIERRCFARTLPCPDPRAFESDDQYRDALDRFSAERLAVELEEGLIDNERLETEAMNAHHALVDRIAAVRAHTMAGLLVKVEVSESFDHMHEGMILSIIEDLVVQGRTGFARS